MPRHRKSFDNPFFVVIASVLALLALNAAAFNVPLIPVRAYGQTIMLGFGAVGIPLLAVLLLVLLFVRRRPHD